jgi:hypothetical protein
MCARVFLSRFNDEWRAAKAGEPAVVADSR